MDRVPQKDPLDLYGRILALEVSDNGSAKDLLSELLVADQKSDQKNSMADLFRLKPINLLLREIFWSGGPQLRRQRPRECGTLLSIDNAFRSM